jgi:hypothetical protein
MFCRFCGAHLLDDSLFCSKCGKSVGRTTHPALERVSKFLRLRTPYPYAVLLVLLVTTWGVWAAMPHGTPFEYADLKVTLRADRKLDLPDEHLFQQGFSLVVENIGKKTVREVPVDLGVKISPPQPAEVHATFKGDRLSIMSRGRALPLTVVLSDEILPGSKRTFLIEGSIEAQTPFNAVYEVRQENSEAVLASFAVER